jgi:hypothetical protein
MVSTPKFDNELLFPVKWPYIGEKDPIFRPTQSYHSVKKNIEKPSSVHVIPQP